MDKRHDYNPFEEYEPTTKASAEEIPQEHYVIAETIVEEATEKTSWLQEVYEWTQAIAVAVVLALIINQFVFAMVQVEGTSMVPTLQDKERLVITKLFYKPKAKDIVVVKSHALGKHIIKRVIAVPGDVIDLDAQTGDVMVNGEVQNEPYIKEKLRGIGTKNQYPLEIPEGYVFVMGDNRNNSQDSRNLGLIAFEDVVGRASLRILPLSRFGTLYKELDD
ncbi:MAG: signal peptidase I [Ruminococcaceae bacterium]|nr:signal peptidase I [Oscillospiraceae bacterium]